LEKKGAKEQEGEGDVEPKGAEEDTEINVKKKEEKGATFLEDNEGKVNEFLK
jgi:hypothetical protein